jgi:hypothetical protein
LKIEEYERHEAISMRDDTHPITWQPATLYAHFFILGSRRTVDGQTNRVMSPDSAIIKLLVGIREKEIAP